MRFLATLLLSVVLWGCGDKGTTVRIGAKNFTEQHILAELIAELVSTRTGYRAEIRQCGDTYECQQALKSGSIDILVEYTGTGAVFSTAIDPRAPDLLEQLRRADQAYGVEWRQPLGFDNGYRIAVPAAQATSHQLSSIADLSKLQDGVRVACPAEYLRRPRDGLGQLLERHGLSLKGEPVVIEDPLKRARALLEGRVDVAVVYATDGALMGMGLTLLDDSLNFYPSYEAVTLVRTDALEAFDGLEGAIDELGGIITTEEMQRLNYAAQLEGWNPADVAGRFLHSRDLVEEGAKAAGPKLEVVLAVAENDGLEQEATRATQALREVFPDRRIKVVESADPLTDVERGDAKVALSGAERFFETTSKGSLTRRGQVQAAVVLGSRVAHLIRREAAPPEGSLAGRIGVGPKGGGRAKIGEALLAAQDGQEAIFHGSDAELLAKVRDGSLDGAVLVTTVGSTEITDALQDGSAVLVNIPELSLQTSSPYLRRARIPKDSYPGLTDAVDAYSAQLVIAGPGVRPNPAGLQGGPAAAILGESVPLSAEEIESLSKAVGVTEAPDPVLPVPWTSGSDSLSESSAATNILDTILNVLVVLFLGWLIVATVRREDDAAA